MQSTVTANNGHSSQTTVIDSPYNGTLVNGKSGTESAAIRIKSRSDREIIRLIGQHLKGLGLNQTAELLSKESGCKFDHPTALRFYTHVIEGDWSKTDNDLQELQSMIDGQSHLAEMKFLLLEQKFLEYLDDGQVLDALNTLRNEISVLNHRTERVHQLSTFIMCSSPEELRTLAEWGGKGAVSRQKLMDRLQEFLPPSVMLPPRRLRTLLTQSIQLQKERCPYHNRLDSSGNLDSFSLLVDHTCGKEDFPSETHQILSDHCDEVLFCQFSHDGTKLATGSKDFSVIIWQVVPSTLQIQHLYTLSGHTSGVAFLAWSPDDRYLISLGQEGSPYVWIWDIQIGDLKNKLHNLSDDSLTSASWQPNSYNFFCGGAGGKFYYCNVDGQFSKTIDGYRIQAIASKNEPKTAYAADTLYRIREYNFDKPSDSVECIREENAILSFTMDESGENALVNVASEGIHLWNLKDGILLRKYHGVKQGEFIIHSCFGGVNQNFIASGSEDKKVYIWHRNHEAPIASYSGHLASVNCVSWNPKYPEMLASASDDRTVRIWLPKKNPNTDGSLNGQTSKLPTITRNGSLDKYCCYSSFLCAIQPSSGQINNQNYADGHNSSSDNSSILTA